jgi:cytochrome c556
MRKEWVAGWTMLVLVGMLALARAGERAHELPAGPLRDRHELMERNGRDAKIIGDALKSGDLAPVGPAAERLRADAARIPALFLPGTTHPASRAKDEIWSHWDEFEALARELEEITGRIASAARDGGDVPAVASPLFGNCKTCHDRFRKPARH